MWASSGVISPSGSSVKSGRSVSTSPLNGAPDPLRRPMSASCSDRRVRSQNSTSIRMTRTTWYDPPAAHPGSSSSGCTQT